MTYLFRVRARTKARRNDGWGPETCLMVSTGTCSLHESLLLANKKRDCDRLVTHLKSYVSPSDRCVPALPELYRPQIGDFVHVDWGITTDGMFDRPPKKFEGNETFHEKPLKISWDLINSGLVPVTKFLIELRSSSKLKV
ncbi:hypothetical protein AHF37_09958 [Paragonimus kellicotti]|nr:hypothetical protein AHF37_09958 [Paragonimus kellicotti]